MHLIGRWERVRELTPRGWGRPWMLDRKWARLCAYEHPEWWRSPDGLWVPVLSGGVGFIGTYQKPRIWIGASRSSTGVQSTVALDSAYTAGTGGDAIAARFVPAANVTVNNIYFFITAYTGTAANVNDINWEIRTGTASVPGTTAPDLVASGTKDPASATGWINISGLSVALTGGTIYWIIIADADGNTTDFATVLRQHTIDMLAATPSWADCTAASTTDGFSTNPTLLSAPPNIVMRLSNGRSVGTPFSAQASSTSSTNRRGLRIDGVTEQLKAFGLLGYVSSANYSGIEIFSGATGPGGTPDASSTQVIFDNFAIRTGAILATPLTLTKSTVYRFVFTYSAAATEPRKVNIGTGNDANLREAMLGGSNWYWAEASGTVDWSNDDTNAWPFGAVLLEDQVAIASGGGLRLAGHGGLAA